MKKLFILILLLTFNSYAQDITTVEEWIKTGNLDPVYPALERLIRETTTAEDSFKVAWQYFKLAERCPQFYDSEIAAKVFQRVREVYVALNKIEYVYYTLIYQANNCWQIDRFSESFALLQQAMTISEKYHFQQTDSVAYYFIFPELGILSFYMRDYVRALKYYDLGLSYYENRPIYAHIPAALYLQKGKVWFQLNDYEKAEENLFLAWEKSQEIKSQVLKQDRQVAILSNLAELYYHEGDMAKAIKFYLRIFPIMKFKDEETDIIYYELGNYQLKAGQFHEALESFRTSLKFGGKTWNALSGLARLKAISNETMAADSLYQAALEAVENRSRYVSGTSVAAFFENASHVYKYAALFYVRAGRPDRALEVVEKAKARYMSRLVSLADLRGDAGIFQDSLKIIEKKINRFYETNPDSVAVNVELYALEIEREKLLEEIRLQNPNYFQFRSTNEISTDSLQRALGETYQLVEYVVSDDSIAALVITNQSTQGVIWAFQKDLLTAMIKNAVTNNAIPLNDLNRLYRMIFQPIEPYLSKEKTLAIVPDGVLYQLPFEMLVTKSGRSYSDSRYILHDYPIVYSVSARLFIDRLRRESKAPLNYAGFAVTTFTDLPSLKFVREQVKNAASIFGRSDYFEDDASTKDKLAVQGGEYKILELATHALVSDAEPLYSKIALWDAVDSIRSDEWLYVHEVYNLKLDADLVSLSGCRTGLGTLTSGEGFIGFNQAFSFAGAASLLMSFWPAEDEATSSVLNVFYNDLNKGSSRAEALRHAKLQYLETAHELKRSPHYWASFTLWGNPKPIRFNPSLMWLWIGFGCGFAVTLGIMIRLKRHSKPSGR